MLAHHNISQLLFIPLRHIVLLLFIRILILLLVPIVRIQTPLLRLALHVQIVREFALLALFAIALLEKLAQNSLWVDAKWHFLDLDGFEELGGFSAGLFCGGLFFLACELFGFFALLLGRPACSSSGLDLFYLFLGGSSLFVFHAKGLVDGDLLHLGLLALAFWWHFDWCAGQMSVGEGYAQEIGSCG
jgi:hypothetical protein